MKNSRNNSRQNSNTKENNPDFVVYNVSCKKNLSVNNSFSSCSSKKIEPSKSQKQNQNPTRRPSQPKARSNNKPVPESQKFKPDLRKNKWAQKQNSVHDTSDNRITTKPAYSVSTTNMNTNFAPNRQRQEEQRLYKPILQTEKEDPKTAESKFIQDIRKHKNAVLEDIDGLDAEISR